MVDGVGATVVAGCVGTGVMTGTVTRGGAVVVVVALGRGCVVAGALVAWGRPAGTLTRGGLALVHHRDRNFGCALEPRIGSGTFGSPPAPDRA